MSEIDDFAPEFRDIIREERRRVLQLLEANKGNIAEHAYELLRKFVENGTDLEFEMTLPFEERVLGFHWPDLMAPKKRPKTKRKKAP